MTRSEEPQGCVFCIARTIGDGRQLIVHEGTLAYVILNKFPYNAGHLMVVPHRHVAQMAVLEDSELSEMAKLTQLSATSPKPAARHGAEAEAETGKKPANGDAHPPVNRLSGNGETRVLPEELPRTAERLRPIFQKLAAAG